MPVKSNRKSAGAGMGMAGMAGMASGGTGEPGEPGGTGGTGETGENGGEMVCPLCGTRYHYSDERRCWECDGRACPHCVPADHHPLCPECVEGASLPRHIQPMLATLSELPREDSGWAYEFKWDGVRALCYWDGRRLVLESRNLLNITGRYPEFSDLGRLLGRRPAILDGEIVALDADGRPSFPLLQQRIHLGPDRVAARARDVPVQYFVFDLLHLGKKTLLREPYAKRRQMLERLGLEHPAVRIPPNELEDGSAMLETARSHGLEGLVAKRLDSIYEPGLRSRQWLKIKIELGQEFVIGGWTSEVKNAERIGSLLVGYYEPGPQGPKLRLAGSVGSGFTDAETAALVPRLKGLERPLSPFADKIRRKNVRYVLPQLVAQVQYRRWPRGGQLHQASYKGLRSDKPAPDVVRERAR